MARKILLADDSVTAQNMGRKILADAGYEVVTVNNGSAALKKIAEIKPDLIVLDVYMPGYSGLEVCQRLKETGDTARIPIVLTVGKLEPFKPEEAKRVRADGFIVKPFEASELLSAISKLEDKIVPRPEASKPGRFARVNAALDEGAYDRSVAMEEDTGWKNRIAFPSKKKKAVEAEEADATATYNPVNKDLRTVVERKPDRQSAAEEPRVDLGALAPEGLPKDVTAEEIAALAAAAAQVKGKLAETAEVTPPPSPHVSAPEAKVSGSETVEIKSEAPALADKPAQEPAALAEASALAETKAPERTTEAVAESKSDSVARPSQAEVPTTVAAVAQSDNSGNGSAPHPSEQEPITMAVAAGAEYAPSRSRWTASPVALLAEEASISLEHEMQKAHAAFAAAEAAHAAPVIPSPETTTPAEIPAPVFEPSAAAEPASEAKSTFSEAVSEAKSEVAEAMHAVAGSATEAISEAVKQLEAVAASFVELHKPAQPAAAEDAPVSAVGEIQTSPLEHDRISETVPVAEGDLSKSETSIEPVHPPAVDQSVSGQDQKAEVAEIRSDDSKLDISRVDDFRVNEPAPVQSVAPSVFPEAASESATHEVSARESAVTDVPKDEAPQPEAAQPPADAFAPPSMPVVKDAETSQHPAEVAPAKEPDIAETTAAAWASWRRIRESRDTTQSRPNNDPNSSPHDSAAMAVAAGAESAPEESASQDSGEIANIVDSVLADLRPKIVAEISKKLGKKK